MQRLLSGELKEVFYLKFLRKLQCITAAIMISVSSMAFPLTVRADVSNEDMLVVAQIEAEMEAQAKQAQASQLQAAVEPVAAKAEEAVQSVGAVVQEAAVAVAEPVQEAVQAPELLSLVGSAATDAGWLTAESYGTRPESRDALNAQTRSAIWTGSVLSKLKGTNYGPSGKESWYNMNMSSVVANMSRLGYGGEYWVRADGVKMLGNYIIAAANFSVHPRGSLVECSLGTCIVCDTGGFASRDATMLDIATAW